MCETIDDKILASIKKCGRGTVFFGSDYITYGTRSAVNKTLERMARDGVIIRVARGIYCYPKIEKVYGLGPVTPSIDEIARAVARKDGAKIIPAEAWAQNQLGLSQQVPMNYVYLTNGAGRSIETADGVQIKFKHASPRYFTMKDMQACLISTALKDWKIENLTEEQIERLRKVVVEHGEYPVEDLKLMPSAVRELVMSFLN